MRQNFMVKHADIVGFVPLLQKLEVVYAKNDGNGGFYKQPALALAVVKDETTPSVTFLAHDFHEQRERDRHCTRRQHNRVR